MRPDQQLENELPEIRDVSGLLMLLRITADILAQVGGTSSDSLAGTMTRLKVVAAAATDGQPHPLPKALRAFQLGHLEPLMIRYHGVGTYTKGLARAVDPDPGGENLRKKQQKLKEIGRNCR